MCQHYEYLVQHPYFRVCFTAILRFNINLHHIYFWGKACKPFFYVGLPNYVVALMQEQNVTLEVSSSFGIRALKLCSSSSSCTPGYQPYDRPMDRGYGALALSHRQVKQVRQSPLPDVRQERTLHRSLHSTHLLTTPRSSPRPREVPLLRPLPVTRSASHGTPAAASHATATVAPVVREPTSALSVDPAAITQVVSGACERDHIITTYHARVFETELRRWNLWECFGALPTCLCCGFSISNMQPLTRTFTLDNHKGGPEHMDFIKAYVEEQVVLGHMPGPFTHQQVESLLGSCFRSSPLSVVKKPNMPGKWRLIQNCSFKDELRVLVNDMIDSDDFPTVWGTAAEVADIMLNMPAGAQFAMLDIDTVFRHIPIYPAHKAYLVIQCEPGAFYIDHVYPFGVSSGKGLQGTIMDSFIALLDLIPVSDHGQQGMVYVHDVQDIFNFAEVLGVPLHKEKWTLHAFEVKYAGFAWDTANRTVALAEKKRVKYLSRVKDTMHTSSGGAICMDLHQVQKLNDMLSHCAFVYLHGCTFLSGLYAFTASFRNEFAPCYPPKTIVLDPGWWRDVLSRPGMKRALRPCRALTDLNVWVDASSSVTHGTRGDGRCHMRHDTPTVGTSAGPRW
ncbi:hypothetical protein NUW54_g20 [Trametes sanguinea]|uniref:Uncharacterized protein n=1 Tax=Trametes sanguinea TaxID=158606 RepID=A0ACC1QC34_9APHY|nr:hypothetical protein NUW54_g20 [Trametes sanguinea]